MRWTPILLAASLLTVAFVATPAQASDAPVCTPTGLVRVCTEGDCTTVWYRGELVAWTVGCESEGAGSEDAPVCVPAGKPTRVCVDGDCVYYVQNGQVVIWTSTC